MSSTNIRGELIEKLAAIEHERWADWQKYVHSKGHEATGYFLIPIDYIERWNRQIATKYEDLWESEKESDREQVRRYLPLIESLLSSHTQEEVRRRRSYEDHCCGCHPLIVRNGHCPHYIYAKSPNEQEVVDLLTKAIPPLEQLKKKFGITP